MSVTLSGLLDDLRFRLEALFDLGGPVLDLILAATFLMWLLIAERALFLHLGFAGLRDRLQAFERGSRGMPVRFAQPIRQSLRAAARARVQAGVGAIRTLVAVCPLLGLLGTVTGMIAVFDVMASAGMGNPRLMADGVAWATVPTMAGMVAGLSGVFALYWIQWQIRRRLREIDDTLAGDGGQAP